MSDKPESDKIDLLAERIRQAEVKPGSKSGQGEIPGSRSGSQIGVDFVGTLAASGLVGWLIDWKFETAPWGMTGLIVVGFGIGIMKAWSAMQMPTDTK